MTEARKEYLTNYRKAHRESHHLYMKEYRQKPEWEVRNKEHRESQKHKNTRLKRQSTEAYKKMRHERTVSPKYRATYIASRKKRFEDPIYRLSFNIGRNIHSSLKRKTRSHWETFLGYNIYELRKHLESLWLQGMSWKNYGKWHVDHKIPESWWIYESPEDDEFKKCWSLANLQPLWATDN